MVALLANLNGIPRPIADLVLRPRLLSKDHKAGGFGRANVHLNHADFTASLAVQLHCERVRLVDGDGARPLEASKTDLQLVVGAIGRVKGLGIWALILRRNPFLRLVWLTRLLVVECGRGQLVREHVAWEDLHQLAAVPL